MNDAPDDQQTSTPEGAPPDLAGHLIDLMEHERERLVRALHDELGSNLTAINLDLASVAAQLPAGVSRTRLERALRVLKDTVELKRHLIHTLRPSMLESLGLVPTLRIEAEHFEARTGVLCELHLGNEPPGLDATRALALYRVMEQALQCIERGGTASHVEITLTTGTAALSLRIEDDGLPAAQAIDTLTMEAQLARHGGTLSVLPSSPAGTRIVAALPHDSTTKNNLHA